MKLWISLLAVVFFCGCSSFPREWKAAAKSPAPTNSIEGQWKGEWRSDKNGHHGELRCVVSKASETAYRAHFRARYWKVLRFTYAATLNGHETNGVVTLEGEADLGKLAGGVYRYKGTATTTDFSSSYESKYDHGKYQMSRVARE